MFEKEKGWDKFWFSGVRSYREEMEFYELLSKPDQSKDPKGKAKAKEGAQEAPIEVSGDEEDEE